MNDKKAKYLAALIFIAPHTSLYVAIVLAALLLVSAYIEG